MNTSVLTHATFIFEAVARELPARFKRGFFSKFAMVTCRADIRTLRREKL